MLLETTMMSCLLEDLALVLHSLGCGLIYPVVAAVPKLQLCVCPVSQWVHMMHQKKDHSLCCVLSSQLLQLGQNGSRRLSYTPPTND